MPICQGFEDGDREECIGEIIGNENLSAAEVRQRLLAKSPTGKIRVNGLPTECLIDTGAEASLLTAEFYNRYLAKQGEILRPIGTLLRLVGANGLEIPVQGYLEVRVEAFDCAFDASFLVLREGEGPPCRSRTGQCPVLLGCNVLRLIAAKLDACEINRVQLDPEWELAFRWLRPPRASDTILQHSANCVLLGSVL